MLFILLPAYNEEEGLEKLLLRIKRVCASIGVKYQLLIINDGSTDRTAQVVESYFDDMPINLINFPVNKGISHVFSTGFSKLCQIGEDNDVVVTMDSDNTHSPYVIIDMLKKISEGYDIVISSRYAESSTVVGLSLFRRFLSYGVRILLRWLIPIHGVQDYSTFYRAYRLSVIKKGFEVYGKNLIEGAGFSSMAGMLLKLSSFSSKIAEIPFNLRYDLKEGGSSMKIFKTITGYLKLIYQFKYGKYSKSIHDKF